jgi:hypothetical protein
LICGEVIAVLGLETSEVRSEGWYNYKFLLIANGGKRIEKATEGTEKRHN